MDFVFLNSCLQSGRKDGLQNTDPHLRVGIASNASYLRQLGAEVKVIDPHALGISAQEVVDEILSKRPRRVGLPAYTEEINDTHFIAELIKAKSPDVTTIIGGYHFSAMPEETLKEFRSFDYGIVGEGERPLGDIFHGREPRVIEGVAYRDDQGVPTHNVSNRPPLDLDALPFPAWDLYDLSLYKDSLQVEPLRGCPYPCSFCFRVLGKRVVFKSARRFVDELEHCISKYGVKWFRFVAGTFPLKKSHTREICEEIISRELDIRWESSTRVDTLDVATLPLLKKSGCVSLQLGIESGDQDLLDGCSKAISPSQSLDIVRECKKARIQVGLNFVIGLPFETRSTVKATLSLAKKLRRYACRANCAILVPFPGTEVRQMAIGNRGGLSLLTDDWRCYGKQAGQALEHENFTLQELKRLQAKFYFEYYLGAPRQALRMFSLSRTLLLLRRFLRPD